MTQASEGTPQTTSQLLPRRRRAKRVGAIFFLLVLLTLTGSWMRWSTIASRRLNAKLAEIRAHHEPLLPEEFNPPTVPANENAATYLQRALDASKPDPYLDFDFGVMKGFDPYRPYGSGYREVVAEELSVNRKSLSLVRQARRFERVDWGRRAGSLTWAGLDEDREKRSAQLARMLANGVLLSHKQGDDREALEQVLDIIHIARVVGELPNSDRRIEIDIESIGLTRLEVITPDIRVAASRGSSVPLANQAAVPRERVLQLINELFDEKQTLPQRRRARLFERMWRYEYLSHDERGATLLRPMLDLDIVRVLDRQDQLLHAVEQPTWGAALPLLKGATPPRRSPPADGLAVISEKLTPPRYSRVASIVDARLETPILQEFALLANRRAAAVMLAVRLYCEEYAAWPANLAALVPEYLPAMPVDPLSLSGQPFGYVTNSLPSPLVGQRPLLRFSAFGGGPIPATPPQYPCFAPNGDPIQWRDLSRWSPPDMKAED